MSDEEDIGLFIDGWDSEDEEAVALGDYLESDSESSYNAFIEERAAPRTRQPVSIADTAAKMALQLWSNMTATEKHQKISASLRKDQQQQTFHKLPSHLNLTAL